MRVGILPALLLPGEPWTAMVPTLVGMGVDSAVLWAMRFVVDGSVMPRPAELPGLRATATPYLGPELRTRPEAFFAFDDAPPREVTAPRCRFHIRGGAIVERRFASPYVPYAETGEARCAGNDEIPVEHWMHDDRTAPATVVALHGFGMGNPWLGAVTLFASQWYRHGLDVALVTLPFHGSRAGGDARFSGEVFTSPHVGRVSEAVRQSVHDVGLVVRWLRRETGGPVGLFGLSLGAYVAALMAGLRDDLDFVVPLMPPVCMGDLAWRFFQGSRHYQAEECPSLAEMRDLYRVHSPLTHRLRVARERLLIVAGRGDRIVPPEHPLALWRHWGEPAIHWFSGSHLAPFGRGRIVDTVIDHLRELDVVD